MSPKLPTKLIYKYIFKAYLFEREREKMQGAKEQREGERESQAGFALGV